MISNSRTVQKHTWKLSGMHVFFINMNIQVIESVFRIEFWKYLFIVHLSHWNSLWFKNSSLHRYWWMLWSQWRRVFQWALH